MEALTLLLLAFGQGALVVLCMRYQREIKITLMYNNKALEFEIEELRKGLVSIVGQNGDDVKRLSSQIDNMNASISALNGLNLKSSPLEGVPMDQPEIDPSIGRKKRRGKPLKVTSARQIASNRENIKKAIAARKAKSQIKREFDDTTRERNRLRAAKWRENKKKTKLDQRTIPRSDEHKRAISEKLLQYHERKRLEKKQAEFPPDYEGLQRLKEIYEKNRNREEAVKPPPGHVLFDQAVNGQLRGLAITQ